LIATPSRCALNRRTLTSTSFHQRTVSRLGLAVAASLLLGLSGGVALAQTAAKPAAVGASAAASPAKKALVKRVIELQQPGIEAMARALVEQPASGMMQQVGRTLQTNVPADKREAVGRDAQNDIRKFVDEVVPVVRKRALEIAPGAIGPILEEKFTEDELKQLVAWLDSPVSRKYQQLGGDMQRALSEPLIRDSRATVEPKMRALEESLMKRLGVSDAPASAAGGKPAAAPTPAKK
jgi:hypothetical protein